MLTVAVDATPLLGRPTGVGVAVDGLLAGLAGLEVDVVGFGTTGTGWRQIAPRLPAGMRAGRGPMPAAVLQRMWATLDAPRVEWWTGPVDVVHGTNFVVPPSRTAARVVTVHDLTPVRYPELCTAASLRYPGLVAAAVRRGATVHTPTRFVAGEVMEHFGIGADRVEVIGWGVTPPPPGAPGPAVTGPPYVLAVGTVEPRKDLPLLVRAFDLLSTGHPALRLRIVGPPGWGRAALEEAVARSAHSARISVEGWVADRHALVAGAAVLAYPSVYEGFGFPPLEAMAAGVPVVATAAGGVPEVVGDAAALVPVGDAEALGGALARVLDDGTYRDELVARGTRRVATFSWAASAASMLALYRRLAS